MYVCVCVCVCVRVCVCAWSRNLNNEAAYTGVGPLFHKNNFVHK